MTRPVVAGAAAGVLALAGLIAAQWEGVSYPVYVDPVGVLTVCYGHTGPELRLGQTYTPEQCQALLQADLEIARAHVNRCLPMPKLVQIESALISATFNIGPRVVCGSTLQKKALANDWPGACAELSRWDKAAGRALRGLTLRRGHERAICERGVQ